MTNHHSPCFLFHQINRFRIYLASIASEAWSLPQASVL